MEEIGFYVVFFSVVCLMIASQFYTAFVIYRMERSSAWAAVAAILPLGLNVLLYQSLRLDVKAGFDYSGLSPDERNQWRKVYLSLLLQYLVLFGFIGWVLSPTYESYGLF
ncbi:hypothetical protein ACFQZE_11050 [Paenibacillus sp. GCM10027627]|uniref:hypothetical protein n=1 Tax=unclassified Paenibacillus TaxID=185978 RepID=UPI003634930F